MSSVVRVVARIIPLNDSLSDSSQLVVPPEFGDSNPIEVCYFTDPRSGLRYMMETAIIVKKYNKSEDILKDVALECERVPGFVCATNNTLSTTPKNNTNANEFAALSLPKSIHRDQIALLVSGDVTKEPSLKHRFNLKKIKEDRKDHQAQKRARNKLLKPLLKFFIEGECLICGFLTPRMSRVAINKHLSQHFDISSYKCDCCNTPFSSPHLLYMHKLNKTDDHPFTCDTCNTRYKRKHQLTVHQLKNHSLSRFAPSNNDQSVWKQKIPPWYSCSICGDRMASFDDISLHKSHHSDKESYQCLFCGKSFVSLCLLRYHSHIRVVTSSRALQQHQKAQPKEHLTCKLCGDKKFYFEKTFLKHMRLIHGAN